MIFWISSNTSPIPNSIAENTKKKNVKDKILRLSYINPINITIEYKVIHNNSAVNNKCREVLVFTTILKSINKKKQKK